VAELGRSLYRLTTSSPVTFILFVPCAALFFLSAWVSVYKTDWYRAFWYMTGHSIMHQLNVIPHPPYFDVPLLGSP